MLVWKWKKQSTWCMKGKMVDFLVAFNPAKYKPFIHTTKDGKWVLYVRIRKSIYGCIESALLWYRKFTSTLLKMGFVINPYKPCIANKTINNAQCTILCWYVDDLKISHDDQNVVSAVIMELEDKYGKRTIHRGTAFEYVGMNILFNDKDDSATIEMKSYIEECITKFPKKCDKVVSTPAAVYLFQTEKSTKKLDEPQQQFLHSITAKLLFIANCARLDIQVPVSFLSSRVTVADESDWKKLQRLL